MYMKLKFKERKIFLIQCLKIILLALSIVILFVMDYFAFPVGLSIKMPPERDFHNILSNSALPFHIKTMFSKKLFSLTSHCLAVIQIPTAHPPALRVPKSPIELPRFFPGACEPDPGLLFVASPLTCCAFVMGTSDYNPWLQLCPQ